MSTGSPSPSPPPQSFGSGSSALAKKDKRRNNMADRYAQLNSMFTAQKDVIYRDTLQSLQTTLAALHAGTDPEYLEGITDFEEERDAELVTLFLYEQFLISRAEREYDKDVSAAEEEYLVMARSMRERLLLRLEGQRKKLKEDKEMLDIANDHSLLLSVAGYPQSPGSGSGGGGMMSVGERRKNLRRRGELSAIAAESGGSSKRRKRNGKDRDEVAAFWSDREPLPFGNYRDDAVSGSGSGASRHREKPFGGLSALKPEEINEDLSILRKKKKKK
ncbi:Sds3-like protein [Dipodascopsis uninucleata]